MNVRSYKQLSHSNTFTSFTIFTNGGNPPFAQSLCKYLLVLLGILFSCASYASPLVTGNTISWPDDGWYQVQASDTFLNVCEGGRSCEVAPGRYIVINHSSGERWNEINVDAAGSNTNGTAIESPEVNGSTISWPDNGWYQVQSASSFQTVCEGGNSCSPGPGGYIVINHTSGERWENINIGGVSVDTPQPNGNTSNNGLTIDGDRISWPDDGWYQVQNSNDFSTICEGGRSCEVPAGTYVVINHSSGQRFNDVVIGAGTAAGSNPPEATGNAPFVNGTTLILPSTGWYQVQRQSDYQTVCEGSVSCRLVPGTDYVAINHSTGERFPDLRVADSVNTSDSSDPYFDSYEFNQQATAGEIFNFAVNATDADGTAPVITVISLPEGATLNTTGPGSAIVSWTPTSEQTGLHYIELEAIDAAGSGSGSAYSDILFAEVWVRSNCSTDPGANVVLLGCIDELNTGFSVAADPAQYSDYELEAQSVGDINGDGRDDLALFTPGTLAATDNDSQRRPVAAHIIFGGNPAVTQIDQLEQIVTQGLGLRIEQQPGSNNRATGIAAAGDFNNDGIDDFLIDANGSTFLIFGRRSFAGNRLVFDALAPGEFVEILDTSNDYDFVYQNANTSRIHSPGDFNGDGQTDLAHVGRVPGQDDTYAVSVILGGLSGDVPRVSLQDLSAENVFRITSRSLYLPLTNAGKFGDFNGDGIDDLLLHNSSEREITLILGRASARGNLDIDELQTGTYQRFLLTQNSGFFELPSGGGDFNGDGLSDFAFINDSYENPSVIVVPGSTNTSQNLVDLSNPASFGGWVFSSTELRNGFADELSFSRDLNGDGFSDLLIGLDIFGANSANNYSVYQINGSATPANLTNASLAEVASRVVQIETGFFGGSYDVRSVPDISGDEVSDLLFISRTFESRPFNFVFGN